MNTTTEDRAKPSRALVLGISLALQVALFSFLWFFGPLRNTYLKLDLKEMQERAQEVEVRERERLEKEKEERKTIAIREEDAEALKKNARREVEKQVRRQVEDMRELRDEIERLREESLERLSFEAVEDLVAEGAEGLLEMAEHIVADATELEANAEEAWAGEILEDSDALRDSTEAFLSGESWQAGEELAPEAAGIREAVGAQVETMAGAQDNSTNDEALALGQQLAQRLDAYTERLEVLGITPEGLASVGDMGWGESAASAMEDAPLDGMELEELVEETALLEGVIMEDFADVRAAELAQINEGSFEDALGRVAQAVGAMSPGEAGAESGRDGSGGAVRTVGDLQNFREQVAGLGEQATQHWTRAVNMGQQAGAITSRNQAGRSGQQFASGQGSGQGSGSGAGGSGANSGVANQGAMGRGGESGKNKTSQGKSQEVGTVFLAETSARGEGAHGFRTRIPSSVIKAKALPGRRFRKDSTRQGWLFLDTWYVIGPWENGGRLNYEQVHPPEIAVDLDAEYLDGKKIPGRDERYPLRWQFVQSDIMRITPPNEEGHSTYYAYTEVFFDEPARMLVAIATDDAARMWVNDKLVWEDQGQSAWNLDEGFRVIDFKQGFNKFLVRIENSPTLCEYSVLLCPPDQVNM